MNKMTAIGAGFHLHLSGNSDLTPQTFNWTSEDTPIKVFIDSAIIPGIEFIKPKNEIKVAWMGESRAIFYEWYVKEHVFKSKQVVELLENSYDALFFADKDYCKLSPKFHFALAGSNLPWCKNKQIFEKSKMTSMIASTKQITKYHILRHKYAEKFKNNIDLFGGALDSKRIGIGPWGDKSEGLNDYRFHIVVENDSYSTYYTEKLTDCFATGTIPVYFGAPDIGDYFNKDGIIILDDNFDINCLTSDLYQSKIDAVKDNFERVQNLVGADDLLYKAIQEL